MFKVPEQYRVTNNPMLPSSKYDGNNGPFKISLSNRSIAWVIVSDGLDWEHVSVHIENDGKDRTPTWSEMCKIKDLFWSDTDCVVQYHPPKSEYVNNHKHCLHLWRSTKIIMPMPDSILVGIK